ncbi:bifunctional ADP-dependent NAD(P)H-hydrate dehydratase/NAD(P)H-hydrate epimerase [Pseudoroseomonas rhizosphaerae]|uniref:Bifunctional NAD(P)H-hydrate repair enzyme n=2 Tax=Teichococcus rhizosphaerae TaxID=1335062 RepID=A0A2C7AF82_9PROT|nr:bifunctional ADP-dependent NAD(P)H-hydrate dehydratase/NAD(P)H-hydrate epimerase [Pseudoroseomonas rhizosphaerae]
MAEADRAAAAAGHSGLALMRAAGRAVAQAVRRRFRPCRVLVLAGPGNNGGDGYVAARLLEQAGWPVAVAPLAPPRPGSDAAAVAAEWRGPVVPLGTAETGRAGLVIDALFGAGLARPLAPELAALLRGVAAPLVAVDVPSGLDGATGQPLGGFAPRAALTVTFFRRKPGHLLLPGRELCGPVELAQIGLPGSVLDGIRPRAFHNAPGPAGEGLWALPRRGAESHKFSLGHVTLVAGAEMPGAARLAAGAARRAGAGLVTVAAPDAATAALFRAGEPGLLVSEAPPAALLEDGRRNAWLLGPGLPAGPETLAVLRQAVEAGRAVVADGGALTAAAGRPAALRGAAVLTPHAGEFARVFGAPGPDRLAAARAAAALTGAVTVLKGADSIVAAPDGRVAINDHAPPALATAGSGDVLAGLVAGLLAQGMAPFEAACAAVWLHGDAAFRALGGASPQAPLVAEELLPEIRVSIASLLPF